MYLKLLVFIMMILGVSITNGSELDFTEFNTTSRQYAVISSEWISGPGIKTEISNDTSYVELRCDKTDKSVETKLSGIKLIPNRHYELSYSVTTFEENLNVTNLSYRLFLSWKGAGQKDNLSNEIAMVPNKKTRKKIIFRVPVKIGSNDMTINCQLKTLGKICFSDLELKLLPNSLLPDATIELDSPLYSGSIFHSYPLDEIKGKLHFEANVNMVKLSLKTSTEEVLWTKAFTKPEGFVIPCTDLKDGDYILLATPFAQDGRSLREDKTLLRKLPEAKDEVIFDNQKNIRINGNLFMPFTIAHATWSNVEQSFYYFSRNGINAISFGLSNSPQKFEKLINLAKDYSLKIVVIVHSPKSLKKKDTDEWENYLKKVLTKEVRESGVILFYSIVDEPLHGGRSLDTIQYKYNFIKKYDPYHPVWINAAPRGSVEELAEYAKCTDIYGVDVYPVPLEQGHNGLKNNRTLSCVGDYAKRMRQTVADRKPIIMFLQAFAWANLTNEGGDCLNPLLPNYIQQRFMNYSSIISGASGLSFWGVAYASDRDYIHNILMSNTREVAEMSSVFVMPDWQNSNVECTAPEVNFIKRESVGKKYIIAANYSNKKVVANFEMSGTKGIEKYYVLYENRMVKLKNNSFVDEFEPYAVHVYSTTAKLPNRLYAGVEINLKREINNSPVNQDLGELMGDAKWLSGHVGRKSNRNLLRKKFTITEMPASLKLEIKSDDYYAAYINGLLVKKDIKALGTVEEYDISKLVTTGENLLSVELINKDLPKGTYLKIKSMNTTNQNDIIDIKYLWDESDQK